MTMQDAVHVLFGGKALSAFRVQALNTALADAGEPAAVVSAHWVYLAQCGESQLPAVRTVLGDCAAAPDAGGEAIYVMPRLGTVSPWSSKATDIARVCGLDVQRLERGRLLIMSAQPGAAGLALLHDRMTESVLPGSLGVAADLLQAQATRGLQTLALEPDAATALARANVEWGLALSDEEIAYLADYYATAGRAPTDAELMMFAQINSEHCRHKIFNADFEIDGIAQAQSLFDMIRDSHRATPGGVLSAYKDNAAVLEAQPSGQFWAGEDGQYARHDEPSHIVIKVETHNHPTAISPDPGAATGAGGEIRDEAATGRGGRTKAGLCGFSVSNLRIPGHEEPWEQDFGKPGHMASARAIMLEGPIGAASFNNEFGRPNLAGYFRCFEQDIAGKLRGYHKPIMIAGGVGGIRPMLVEKQAVPSDALLIVLGGPAMLIGLGGAAGSSVGAGDSSEALDFASVQRANPEMERRAQEVIDACCQQGDANPIVSIHDVGAGGISNALPELIDEDSRGGTIRLRDVHVADPALSPMEIWCNESQERYVLAIAPGSLDAFSAIAARERCPFAVVGEARSEPQLTVEAANGEAAVDMPMPVLLGKTPKMHRAVSRQPGATDAWTTGDLDLADAIHRVLGHPTVASKSFLITIGDRCITGLVVRDQMVGPWQVPVADCAVTAAGYAGYNGEAMAMGERTPVAVLDGPASGRMAVGEALTNLLSTDIDRLEDIRLSANWMAACGEPGEDAALYDTVKAVGSELCPALGLAIPVGKDSLSMRTRWQHAGEDRQMTAPLSLIVSAFAPVRDVRRGLTPEIQRGVDSELLLVDLGFGKQRLGGSMLAQCHQGVGSATPDIDDADALKRGLDALIAARQHSGVLAWHDRSDGGLLACLAEMAFAGRSGLAVTLPNGDAAATLFNEELGVVLQVRRDALDAVMAPLHAAGVPTLRVATPGDDDEFTIAQGDSVLFASTRTALQQRWAEVSWRMQRLRDAPACADSEFELIEDAEFGGLYSKLSYNPSEDICAPYVHAARPRVAILREQGVNSAREMAWAFDRAGFDAIDVHMSDLIDRGASLEGYAGLVAPGGFSYGDVLGAGRGWAASVQFHERLREMFAAFFARDDRFALGVCNGCQMLAALRELIPGTEHWPRFVRNSSEQFEGRVAMVRVPEDSNSIFMAGMGGSCMPVAVSHGEGRAEFAEQLLDMAALESANQIALRYVDSGGLPTDSYPLNPNGSPGGITGVSNADGRVLALMPHPERVVRSVCNSWADPAWGEDGPWMRMFRNARVFVG